MDVAAVQEELRKTSFLTGLELKEMPVGETVAASAAAKPKTVSGGQPEPAAAVPAQKPLTGLHHEHETQVISVRVDKLDRLLDLVGELVISESMVIQNPDIADLELDNFQKAARQLQKISSELQDSVMSLRMVPLEGTFKKMNRIVRDMTKKLGKKARLVLQGEDTEVDKSIIDHIGDPLMHIVRNSIDHGIERPEDRRQAGKPETGTVTISASNEGGEVILRIKDDGSGLDREKILQQARQRHLFTKPEAELTDSEIYHFIFLPGFSTKEKVTEFSGRGVGMDVVVSNIRALGGNVAIESALGQGSTTIIRIPLTLAIIDGMSMKAGHSRFTIPISSISRSFRPGPGDIIKDAAGHEMFMEEGRCCPIMRLYERYGISEAVTDLEKGILIVVESRVAGTFAVMADMLLGVQEIVVKPVPKYISRAMDMTGISGCTLLGDGNISLILDAEKLGRKI
jgi:two-component system chemotaxis sensor kinase CheA